MSSIMHSLSEAIESSFARWNVLLCGQLLHAFAKRPAGDNVARKDAIQPMQHCPGAMGAGHDGLHRHLDHRDDERGRDTVSGHVSDQEANPVLIENRLPLLRAILFL